MKNSYPNAKKPASDTLVKKSFPVEGMTCHSCARKVEAALSEFPGVVEVSVDLAGRNTTVRFDSRRISTDDLI